MPHLNLGDQRTRPNPSCASLWRVSFVVVSSMACMGASMAAVVTTARLAPLPLNTPVGQAVVLAATVTTTGVKSVDNLTVTFSDNAKALSPNVKVSGGKASFTLPVYTTAGSHVYSVVYNGGYLVPKSTNTDNTASTIVRFPTTTTLSTSTSSSSTRIGEAVLLTAKVASTVAGGTPTGPVVFSDGTTRLGTANVSGGVANLNVSFATAGTHNITAVYNSANTDQSTMSSSTTLGTSVISARAYYIDANAGQGSDDLGSGTLASPWASLAKLSTITLNAGDAVYLANGSVISGTLVPKSGVTYSNYVGQAGGSTLPVVSGAVNVGLGAGKVTWEYAPDDKGNPIYRAKVADLIAPVVGQRDIKDNSFPAAVSQLILNGERLQRARYPQVGAGTSLSGQKRYLQVQSAQHLADSTVANVSPAQSVPTYNLSVAASDLPIGVTAADLQGAEVYAKNYDWYLEHYTVSAVPTGTSNTVTVQADPFWPYGTSADQATLCAKGICRGYWLENKLWMLKAPGQWVYDPSGPYLYVWMKDGSSPAQAANLRASIYAHAAAANTVSNVLLKNITFADSRFAGIGLVNASNKLTISGVNVLRAGAEGILVRSIGALAAKSEITGSTVSDSVNEGIHLGVTETKNLNLTNNIVSNAGRGYYARAGILLGHGGIASGNRVTGASYIGIRLAKSNTVTGNWVESSCVEFDDCGGIYTRGVDYGGTAYGLTFDNDVSSTISNNVVIGMPLSQAPDRWDGMLFGSATVPTSGAVNGIYLDDYSGDVTVSGNYVSKFDLGVMLHLSRTSKVLNNTLVDNLHGIRMQENANDPKQDLLHFCQVKASDDPEKVVPKMQNNCDADNYIYGNEISGNAITGTAGQAIIIQDSDFKGTSDFATYSNNLYATFNGTKMVYDNGASLTLAQWQQAGKDAGSSIFSTADAVVPTAANLLNNGNLSKGLNGWSGWQETSNAMGLSVAAAGCEALSLSNACLVTDAAFGSNTYFHVYTEASLQPITLQAGQAYAVGFDAQVATPGAAAPYVQATFLHPSQYYNLMTEAESNLFLSSAWQRKQIVLTANATDTARLNFKFFTPSKISLANLSVYPITTTLSKAQPVGFYATDANKTYSCPNADGANCDKFVNLRTKAAIGFPLTVAAGQSLLAVVNNPLWVDADGDGVPGDTSTTGADACANTAAGAAIGLNGCAVGQTASH
jgi:parallel beta-helix repeat protein